MLNSAAQKMLVKQEAALKVSTENSLRLLVQKKNEADRLQQIDAKKTERDLRFYRAEVQVHKN